MTWYRGWYGSYRNGSTVKSIEGTFDRKEMFKRAQDVANETKEIVTIEAEKGMRSTFYKVEPER